MVNEREEELPSGSVNTRSIFTCQEHGCTKEFRSFTNLQRHMSAGNHHFSKISKIPLSDTVKTYWIRRYGCLMGEKQHTWSQVAKELTSMTDEEHHQIPQSWALQTNKQVHRYSNAVHEFLKEAYVDPENPRVNINDLVQQMRNDSRFKPSDWLNSQQIKGYFGTLKRKLISKKSSKEQALPPVEEEVTEASDHLENVAFEQEIASVCNQIEATLTLTHPVIVNGSNLCDLNSKGTLKKMKKEEMLSICSAIGYTVSRRNESKQRLLERLSSHLNMCQCKRTTVIEENVTAEQLGGASVWESRTTIKTTGIDSAGVSYGIVFENEPFAEGACKAAYHGHLTGDGQRQNEHVVVKVMKGGPIHSARQWIPEKTVSQHASAIANSFKDALSKMGIKNAPSIDFCTPIIAKVNASHT